MRTSDEDPVVVAIAGRIASGKTTLGCGLHERLGWPIAAFGTYIREVAEQRQLPSTRESLQDLGAALIEQLGFDRFCLEMLSNHGLSLVSTPFVVEGVRHRGTIDALRRILVPADVLFVFLDVSDHVRNDRLARLGVDPATGLRWERHSTEREVVGALRNVADAVVSADRPAGDVLATLLRTLRQR